MLFLLALSVTLCVAICPNINEVLRTVRMSESISQVRSVSSRMDIGEASWNAFQEYPIMGVGNNNLTLATNKDLFENDDTSYTSYAPSIIFQLFSEKGIVGLIIWFAMILCVCYFFFRSDRRKIVTCLMFSAIILLVIRELTFSAFFRVTGIQMLAYVIIVLFINSLPQKLIPCIAISAKKWRTISYMPLMGYILILIVLIQQNTDRYNNAEFIKNVVVYKDVNGAQEYIEKTACSTPFLINRSIVYWELFNQTNDTLYLQKAKMNINKAIGKSANDIILKYNMATILQAEGKLDSAFTMINKLVKQYPENSLYNWRLYNIYHLLKEDIKSKNHLKKAIYQNPGLAEVGRVYCILQCDIPLKQSIIEKCKEDNAFTDCNPIRLAKNGKILLSLGDTINAELYLKKAIMLQPNLMVPWQLLQVISRKNNDSVKAMYYKQHYLALSHYVKQGSVGKMQYIDSLQNLFANKYMIKYKEWYGETTIPQLIFIPNEIEQ